MLNRVWQYHQIHSKSNMCIHVAALSIHVKQTCKYYGPVFNLYVSARPRGRQQYTAPSWNTAPSGSTFIPTIISRTIPTTATSLSHRRTRHSHPHRKRLQFPSSPHHHAKRWWTFYPWSDCCPPFTNCAFPCVLFQSGGTKEGLFDSYPSHSADPYTVRRFKQTAKGPVFLPSPGPKSTPVKSIIAINVNRSVLAYTVSVNVLDLIWVVFSAFAS